MHGTHHALVSYGSPSHVRAFALMVAKQLGVSASANENFHIRSYSTLDVEKARTLRDLMSLSGTGKRILVIAAQAIGREAQNALLKIVEEPGENVTFAFLVPRGALIETLKSRCTEISFETAKADDREAIAFLSAQPSERTKHIEKIVKAKDKQAAYELVCSLERVLEKKISDFQYRVALEELLVMRGYVTDPSASVKMILEHLSLVLPVVK